MSTGKGRSERSARARKVGVEMFTTTFSIIGAVLAMAVLLLMALSSILLEQFSAHRSSDESITHRTAQYPGNAGSAGPVRRSGVASARATGGHAVLPGGHAGSLPC